MSFVPKEPKRWAENVIEIEANPGHLFGFDVEKAKTIAAERSEVAAKESGIKAEEEKVKAAAAAKEEEAAKKRKGRGTTILTGSLGLLNEAPVARKQLLGS